MYRHSVVTRKGFGLIELLVVIAIIVLLIGIAVPVLARGREAARMARCQSNLIQMSLSTRNYATDAKDELPEFVYIHYPPGNPSKFQVKLNGNPSWAKPGFAVLGKGLVLCPSDSSKYQVTVLVPPGVRQDWPVSYTPNIDALVKYRRLHSIARPSEMAWFWDGQMEGLGNGLYKGGIGKSDTYTAHRHMDRACVGFLDGRTQVVAKVTDQMVAPGSAPDEY